MTLKQFEDQYPNFTGLIFIDGGFFLDSKLKEQLDILEIKYIHLKLMNLETSFLKWFNPDIGINLGFIENGKLIRKYSNLSSLDNLKNFMFSK